MGSSRASFVALVVLAACKREPSPAAAPPALKIWPHSTAHGETISCRGGFCSADDAGGDIELALDDRGALNASLETSRGNTVTMLGDSAVLGATRDATFPHALERFADGRALADWLDVDVTVKTPDGVSSTSKAQLRIGDAMKQRIEKAKTAAVRFPGETLGASAGKLAYVRPSGGGVTPFLLGDGRWRDIDLVAFENAKRARGIKCPDAAHGLAIAGHGGVLNEVWTETEHTEVSVYDRRAGKLVETKPFDAAGACPTNDFDASGLGAFSPSPPSSDAAIREWVRSKLAP